MEKKLTLNQLVMTGTGHVIGAGIVSVIGPALSATGNSVPLAFIAACVISYIRIIPTIFFTSAMKVHGGKYGMVRKCLGEKFSPLIAVSSLLSWTARGTAVAALAGYMSGLFPRFNGKVIAFTLWAVFALANLKGVDVMGRIQSFATPVLICALMTFSLIGLLSIRDGFFTPASESFFKGGAPGFLTAVMLLSYSCDGVTCLANYSDMCENPKRNIPFAMTCTSVITAVIYTSISFVRAGILQGESIGDAALLQAAKSVFSGFCFTLFIIAGPVFALITTMNSGIVDSVLPVAAGAEKGDLPKVLALKNKNGRYFVCIAAVFAAGAVPLILGLPVGKIAGFAVATGSLSSLVILLSAARFPFVCENEWKASKLYIPDLPYFAIIFVCAVCEIFITIQSLKSVGAELAFAGVIAVFVFSLYAVAKQKTMLQQSTAEQIF